MLFLSSPFRLLSFFSIAVSFPIIHFLSPFHSIYSFISISSYIIFFYHHFILHRFFIIISTYTVPLITISSPIIFFYPLSFYIAFHHFHHHFVPYILFFSLLFRLNRLLLFFSITILFYITSSLSFRSI
ncbi:hypothetical protein GLOIN_2v1603384, partial [Rhizophagus irregularis DAOM 181602=DAOM 197198]